MFRGLFNQGITYKGKRDKGKTDYYNEILIVESKLKEKNIKMRELEVTKKILLDNDIPFSEVEEQYFTIFKNLEEALNVIDDVNRSKMINIIKRFSLLLRESNDRIQAKYKIDKMQLMNDIVRRNEI